MTTSIQIQGIDSNKNGMENDMLNEELQYATSDTITSNSSALLDVSHVPSPMEVPTVALSTLLPLSSQLPRNINAKQDRPRMRSKLFSILFPLVVPLSTFLLISTVIFHLPWITIE